MEFLESDWKTFRALVPEWRERYLERQNKEFVALLSKSGKTPTEIFWDLQGRIENQAKILRACFDGHSRSKMTFYLFLMYEQGIIGKEDFNTFSAQLRDSICVPVRKVVGA